MAGKVNLKETFSKPSVQWTIIAILLLTFIVIMFSVFNAVKAPALPPTVAVVTAGQNATVESILTATAEASRNIFPATWTVTATNTAPPAATSTLTPTITNTGAVTLTATRTLTRTPTRTKTVAYTFKTATPIKTKTPTRTPTVAGKLSISMLPASQTFLTGGTATFTVTVTNIGAVTVTDIITDDTLAPNCSKSLGTLAPGASTTYSCTKTGVTASFTNFISAMGRDPAWRDVWTNTTAAVVVTVATPHITLTKIANVPSFNSTGQTITYTITAINDGNVDLTNVTISDPILGTLTCIQPITLAPSGTLVCTGTHATTQADLDAGTFANTASVSGTSPSSMVVTATATHTLSSSAVASVAISKSPDSPSFDYGSAASFTITVTNDGPITLSAVSVSDALSPDCVRAALGSLAPGASASYSCSAANVTADFTNSATVSATPATGSAVTDTATANVVVLYNPVLSLIKSVSDVTYSTGETLTYTLTAANQGNVTLTNVSISDPKLGTLDCTPTQPATLLSGESMICTADHLVTADDLAYGAIYNTAEATATTPKGATLTDSDFITVLASPVPDRVAFTVDVDSDGQREIVSMATDGSAVQTINNVLDMHFGDWAASRDWMVFSTDTGTLYRIRPDGTELTLIPNQPSGSNMQAEWSPNNNWIVFVNVNASQTDLYMIQPDGSNLTRLTNDAAVETDPSWVAGSTEIYFVYSGDPDIYKLTVSPVGTPTILVDLTGGSSASPHGNTAGTAIIFARDAVDGNLWDIYTADSSGGSIAAMTGLNNTFNQTQPAFSRDGTTVIYLSDATGAVEVYIGTTAVPNAWSGEAYPAWMP